MIVWLEFLPHNLPFLTTEGVYTVLETYPSAHSPYINDIVMALEPYSQVCLVYVNSGDVSTGWQIVYKKICWEVEVEAFLLGAKGSDINFPAT